MENIKLHELRELLEHVAFASTKKEARSHLNKLKFRETNLKCMLNGYTLGHLSKAINCADQASGNVRDKEKFISDMESYWINFENEVE
ncbi:hypothetical protein [Alteromonas stellipolaris]|uniref:hypothetical protein n=1 Tax=Alteromonas stellipolaris TaxID=233316 RepID=UPI0030F7864D